MCRGEKISECVSTATAEQLDFRVCMNGQSHSGVAHFQNKKKGKSGFKEVMK